jgi:ABC-type nitrate/sulfonate/bicarbonate transport system permease component
VSWRARLRRAALLAVPILLLLVGWELLARVGEVNAVLFSRPSAIAVALSKLLRAESPGGWPVLLVHMLESLARLGLALAIATPLGLGLGLLMGAKRWVRDFFDPLLTVFMAIPGLAWAPLLLVWLGFGDTPIVVAGALSAFFPIVYNASAGVRGTDPALVRAARSMGARGLGLYLRVRLPAATPRLLTGFKLGFARAWRVIIAVEMIAATTWGLGYMIFDAREYLQSSLIYGGILLMSLVFLAVERGLVGSLERLTVARWGLLESPEEAR